MQRTLITWGSVVSMVLVLAGCGGSGGDSTPPPVEPPPPTATLAQKLAAAAATASNDTADNAAAPFTVLQAAGVPAVTVASPPKVNFAVFSDGAIKKGLTLSNVAVAIAKLVPGSNGDPDQWVNYVSRKEVATAGVGPGGMPVLAEAWQATTDLKDSLVENADGYYTYTFKADIKDPAWKAVSGGVTYAVNGVAYEPARTHRIAIQLSYTNAAGETVRVNPYFDFTLDAAGNSVAVTDQSKTRKMTDVSSCNGCHEKLALHGGGRIDTQYCVMCHNPGTTDANSGYVLTLSTMAHSIHAGRLLKSKLDAGQGGEDYAIWGYRDSKHDYAEVGFPQDLRNCTKCHSGTNAATPQGDNWKTVAAKSTCLSCHASKTGSDWDTSHQLFARDAGVWSGATPGAKAMDLPNSTCLACHKAGTNLGSDRVHWNQNEENAAKYKMNIESTTYNPATRTATVKYYLSDPTNANAAYNLVTSDCTGTPSAPACSSSTKFGNLRLYLAYQNLVGQSTAVTEFTAYNNGGSSANAYAYKGLNDGANRYTIDITVPADTATAIAAGTARVVSIGQIKEAKLMVKWATDPRPEAAPLELVNVVVQHTFKDLALSGPVVPRRKVVSNEKCNVCHGALGTTSGSNLLANAFHGGARNTVEACVLCHDPNRMSSTKMTNGLSLNESYQFKRMIHGIHGNSKRTYPFTHGNAVFDAFNKDGTSMTPGNPPLASGVENYAAEVAWPGVGINCNACHVDNSYKQDLGTVGAVVSKPTGVTDLLDWLTISSKAATCTACHDSSAAIGHVTSFGQASFANRSQRTTMLGSSSQVGETCNDCHASGGFKGVDVVHGQK